MQMVEFYRDIHVSDFYLHPNTIEVDGILLTPCILNIKHSSTCLPRASVSHHTESIVYSFNRLYLLHLVQSQVCG